jgi:hypothetical protein
MFGKFQQSQIRIEVSATAKNIEQSLLYPKQMVKWLWYQRFNPDLPEKLYTGLKFTSYTGTIPVDHQVELLENNCLRLILSNGIDGYHEWYWGDNWLQSRLEGISILPLNLGQTLSLLSLSNFLKGENQKDNK